MEFYYKLSYYWFGITEGILLTAIPSLFFLISPYSADILHTNQLPSELMIFWIRCASMVAMVGGLVLFTVFKSVRDLKVHLGVLSCYFLGDFIYLANLLYTHSQLDLSWSNSGFLQVFILIILLTVVRGGAIGYLIRKIND